MKKICFCLFLTFTLSCNKTEYIDYPPQLRFSVIDEQGRMVSGACIILYSTYDDWWSMQNPIDSALTDNKGTYLFKNLQEVYYFFDVAKGDSLKNTPNCTSTEEPLKKGVQTNLTILLQSFSDDK